METIKVNAANPEFQFVVEWKKEGLLVANAPRPLGGEKEFYGPYRNGRFYVASKEIDTSLLGGWECNGASLVKLTTNEKIMEELKEYAKEQGYRVTEFVEAWNGWEIWARQEGKEWYEVKK